MDEAQAALRTATRNKTMRFAGAGVALVLLAAGVGARLAQVLERHGTRLRRRLMLSFPSLFALVLVSAGSVFGGDWLRQRAEARHPRPPADAPNVLLIVMDTVRADRMSLYGYGRRTTPNLERMARQAI